MNRDEKEKLIQQFLDGDLDDSREAEALRLMAEDEDLRDLLNVEISLNRAFNQSIHDEAQSFAVPEEFTNEVMHAIEQREQEQEDTVNEPSQVSAGLIERIQQGLGQLFKPRPVRFRPAYGLAAVLIAVGIYLGLSIGNQTTTPAQQIAENQMGSDMEQGQAVKVAATTTDHSNRVRARFFYVNNEAESVAVAGDFSDWEPVSMEQKVVDGKTVWTGTVKMERGEHRYMYIVNGEEWKTDPLAERYTEDGFGNRNAVLSL